ncbi:RebB family R body protein [Chryseobacterium proteolyticum]|uniref:RebB family R body protein n=1 Tax=Chryseobacterium proteolyticum TaxID=118127 RepID=UPI003983452A
MIHNQNEINLEVVGMAPTVPTAISMQVNAHSTGLMYEQSVSHQQRDALIGLSNSVMGIKKIGSRKLKKRAAEFQKRTF